MNYEELEKDIKCPRCKSYNVKYTISRVREIIGIYCYNCDQINIVWSDK